MDSSAFVFLFYQLDYVLLPSLPRQMQGGSFPVSVLSLQETLIALPRSLITSAVSSEKMQSIFSSPESKIGGVFSKLIASNLRRAY